jgi:hypothetical protein
MKQQEKEEEEQKAQVISIAASDSPLFSLSFRFVMKRRVNYHSTYLHRVCASACEPRSTKKKKLHRSTTTFNKEIAVVRAMFVPFSFLLSPKPKFLFELPCEKERKEMHGKKKQM